MELRQTIKETLQQGKLKEFKKLVHQYFLVLKPVAADGKNNLDYRFYKQRMGR